MKKTIKEIVIKASLFITNKAILNIASFIFFITICLFYFFGDREKFALYIISFAINQLLFALIFGTGLIMSINVYLIKKAPNIIDEFLLKKNKDLFMYDSHIYSILKDWENEINHKPVLLNTIGKELLLKYFIKAEIKYIEYNLAVLIEDMFEDLDDIKYLNSNSICDQFLNLFINRRVDFSKRFSEDFFNRFTTENNKINSLAIKSIIFQKFINCSASFNFFFTNCIYEIKREEKNRFETLKILYSDLVKIILSYKDCLSSDFEREFDDIGNYNLFFDGCHVSLSKI